MAVKKCCIENCQSCSTRKEDIGVTYHKYPKDERLCDTWITITRNKQFNITTPSYVCSRHFCKRDFQIYKDCKYVLKSDAVPSIFPWNKKASNMNSNDITSDAVSAGNATQQIDFDTENLEAIKKFIEDQAKETEIQKCDEMVAASDKKIDMEEKEKLKDELTSEMQEEPLTVATSVMDLILSQSEARMLTKKEEKCFDKECLSPEEKGNNMALSVGSKVEAKDFEESWHPAEIIEVDYDEMEVLVHYENSSKKHDEWISVNSPRLRPFSTSPIPTTSNSETDNVEVPIIKEEVKQDEKSKLKFVIGERCLARWRDNRRFIATINKDLGNGSYEIIFDDGFHWKCTTSRLFKLKETEKIDPSSEALSSSSISSPISFESGPSTAPTGSLQTPIFHTHLFDPTRDYLGTKSERREKKRKLNIKEIFNIGQKKRKMQRTPKETNAPSPKVIKQEKPKPVQRKIKLENNIDMRNDIPDALASIIGTIASPEVDIKPKIEVEPPNVEMDNKDDAINIPQNIETVQSTCVSGVKEDTEVTEPRNSVDPVLEEEIKLQNFEVIDDKKHEEVIDRIKEAIIKLEDGITKTEKVDSPKVEIPEEEDEDEIKDEIEAIPVELTEDGLPLPEQSETTENENESKSKTKKAVSHLKRDKKFRLLQAKAKKKMEKVECELAEMKRQVEEMRKQIVRKQEMPESFMLPGEWCCRWVNGQPVGSVSEIESEIKQDPNSKPPLPRRSVQVEDKRLPVGWTKHMVRRSFGNSAGKWDVVLVSPENRRFHTKTDMRTYIEKEATEDLKPYEHALLDFGIHLKKKLNLNRVKGIVKSKDKKRKWSGDAKIRRMHKQHTKASLPETSNEDIFDSANNEETPNENATLEDGYVFVGSLKVQVIENLLRCPADGCFKNFRNNTLLKMHIKHYHRELRKLLGATPKVLDLAYARTRPTKLIMTKIKSKRENKVIKVKIPKPAKRPEVKIDMKELDAELKVDIPISSPPDLGSVPKTQDSPKLRNALVNKPVKRPKVLLPVRRLDSDRNENFGELGLEARGGTPVSIPDVLDFETSISTHTVTKPIFEIMKKEKKRREFASFPNNQSEEDDWLSMNSDVETRSSFPGSGTPDSKVMDTKTSVNAAPSSESNEDHKEQMYTYTETGERIKIVQMKREEIINCHCGYREEDGLMVQCELCLCWQHALCHNIQRESEVTSTLKPLLVTNIHSSKFSLLRVQDALHALRVKYYVATKKDHPKLYLWAKDWENTELTMTQEKLNSDYSDLNIMIHNIGKENLPLKTDDVSEMAMDVTSEERDIPLGPQTLLSGLLSSPGGTSLELPISTSELERLAKCVQEQSEVRAPQPEAAIESGACRERLLRHIQRCQALLDSRLDSIEAQVAELESQDPLFEDDETAEYFPRTKQTIQMLLRDLDTMEELGVIT
ncbi:PREDICTED: uncharacterized protein LOC106111005 [Papilio polytes]|uniref:uncharacterized protein LOC106111005 n=1 Tax=Papilio polytes TaxID=76194 RepID=UPI000675DBB1|nr:PREDICTED: uncharacterized protein LOC106111005 [Papilio polytes]